MSATVLACPVIPTIRGFPPSVPVGWEITVIRVGIGVAMLDLGADLDDMTRIWMSGGIKLRENVNAISAPSVVRSHSRSDTTTTRYDLPRLPTLPPSAFDTPLFDRRNCRKRLAIQLGLFLS